MPRNYNLIGSYISRKESPEIEMLMQEALGEAITISLSSLGVYQNTKILTKEISCYLKAVSSELSIEYVNAEFSKRPFVPISPDLPTEHTRRAQHFCGISDNPLKTPQDEMSLSFPLPSIKTRCDSCKDESVFNSIGSIWCDALVEYYPHLSDNTEQIFTFYYQCSLCKKQIITFMLKRRGLTLQLCGRSERCATNISRTIPKNLRPILQDAVSATNENDLHAGFYHLRTFVEHYMKNCLKLPIEQRMTGDELSSEYNATLDNRMKEGIPAMSTIYELSSKHMHARTGNREDFNNLINDIEAHISAKELFEKYRV